jgi:hypothetical protein
MKQVVMSFAAVPCYVEPGIAGPYDCLELGIKWLDWVANCSPDCIAQYDLVLLVPREVQLPQSVKAWRSLTRINENSYINNYPEGANAVFKQAIWCQYHGKIKGPFLWCEPDCIPVKIDWLSRIEEEYVRWNKPFMGGIVEPIRDQAKRVVVPRHMTGNAVYPDKCWEKAPKLLEATFTPWDVLAAPQILPQCAETKLIQHEYRKAEMLTLADIQSTLRTDTALFHSDKYGAIQRLLGNRGLLNIVPKEQPIPEVHEHPVIQELCEQQAIEEALAEPEIEWVLSRIKNACQSSKDIHRKVSKFMVENELVTVAQVNFWKPKTNLPRKPRLVSPKSYKDTGVVMVRDLDEIREKMKQQDASSIT